MFVTLTQPRRREDCTAAVERWLDAWRTLQRTGSRQWTALLRERGCIRALEVTRSRSRHGDWHPHGHLLVPVRGDSDSYAEQLVERWLSISGGDRRAQDIRPADAASSWELSKYVTKVQRDLSPEVAVSIFAAVVGRQVFRGSGLWKDYNKDLPELPPIVVHRDLRTTARELVDRRASSWTDLVTERIEEDLAAAVSRWAQLGETLAERRSRLFGVDPAGDAAD